MHKPMRSEALDISEGLYELEEATQAQIKEDELFEKELREAEQYYMDFQDRNERYLEDIDDLRDDLDDVRYDPGFDDDFVLGVDY